MYGACAPAPVSCDPVGRTGCPAGYACVFATSGENRGETLCVPEGEGGTGESCAAGNGCVSGSGCYDGRCWAFCLLEGGCGGYCQDHGHPVYGVCPG